MNSRRGSYSSSQSSSRSVLSQLDDAPSDKPKSYLRTLAGAAKFGIDSMDDVAAAAREILPLSEKAIAGAIGGAFMLLSIMQLYDSYLEYQEWDDGEWHDDGLSLFYYFNYYRVYSNFVFDLNSFALSVAYVLAPWVTVLGAELFPFVIMASMTEKSFMKLLEVWGEYNKAQNELKAMDDREVDHDSFEYKMQEYKLELSRNTFIFQCVDFACTASITSLIGMVTFWALVTASQVPTLGLSIPVVIILSIAVIAITSKWLQNRSEKQIEKRKPRPEVDPREDDPLPHPKSFINAETDDPIEIVRDGSNVGRQNSTTVDSLMAGLGADPKGEPVGEPRAVASPHSPAEPRPADSTEREVERTTVNLSGSTHSLLAAPSRSKTPDPEDLPDPSPSSFLLPEAGSLSGGGGSSPLKRSLSSSGL